MKRKIYCLIVFLLWITGCSKNEYNNERFNLQIESVVEETKNIETSIVSVGDIVHNETSTKAVVDDNQKENVYNWRDLKDSLSIEDYVTVELFLPILQEKENVRWSFEENEVLECSLDDFVVYLDNVIYEAEYEVDELINPSVACCDMDSDTNKELIIEIDNCAGQYIILFNIDNNYYGTVKSVRQFEELYANGLYYVSGGGWSAYCKMKLEEGILKDEKIALVDYEEKAVYYIEDTPVSEEDFYKWEHKNTMNRISFVKVKSDL